MNQQQGSAAELIRSGSAILGIEFGSTRIKASLIAPDTTPLASGSHAWENQLEDGVWTYDMEDVWKGLAACYASLVQDVRARYSRGAETVAAMGFSGMMHGYVALDADGQPAGAVPHLAEQHHRQGLRRADPAPRLRRAAALEHRPPVPVDPGRRSRTSRGSPTSPRWPATSTGSSPASTRWASARRRACSPSTRARGDWDAARMAKFDALIAPRKLGWKLRDILPAVLPAGRPAGSSPPRARGCSTPRASSRPASRCALPRATRARAWSPPTRCARARAMSRPGTSVFAMIVLEKSLSRVHEEIDIVVTPDGKPVAMAHSNNGSSDLDAWIALFGQVARALGAEARPDDLYGKLLPLAVQGDPDAGGLLSINYVSGEHMTGFTEGRPLFARNQDSKFTLENFVRAMYYASLCAMRTGMNILTEEEGVVIEEIRGHGGFFKGGDTGQRMMAAALNVPVSIPATAGEGGAWGMAVLAAYMLRADAEQSLPDYLDERIAGSIGKPVKPDPRDVEGFAEFFARHKKGLAIEREAVKALS